MKASFLGKLLERVEHLSPEEMQTYLVRLARENGYLETIFNTLHDGVMVLAGDGTIDYCNAAAVRLLPLPHEVPPGATIQRYLRELPWGQMLGSGQGISRRLEITYPEPRVLEFYLLPLEAGDERGESPAHVAIFHDITRSWNDTREAVESERMRALTLLAAGVAHELGNPINSLNIHLQLMQRDLRGLPREDAARFGESISVARREIDRLDGIIHQFLRAIRPTLPEFRPVRLADLVEETLTALGPEIDDRRTMVRFDPPAVFPEVPGDPGQLKQVFYNLVRNAMQAMDGRGELRIDLRAEEGWAVLEFRDNGTGIAAEDLPQVRDPYFTTKTKSGGSGLGLMIVERVVREHGGMLELESGRGRGTVVRIKLPTVDRRMKLLEAGTRAAGAAES